MGYGCFMTIKSKIRFSRFAMGVSNVKACMCAVHLSRLCVCPKEREWHENKTKTKAATLLLAAPSVWAGGQAPVFGNPGSPLGTTSLHSSADSPYFALQRELSLRSNSSSFLHWRLVFRKGQVWNWIHPLHCQGSGSTGTLGKLCDQITSVIR